MVTVRREPATQAWKYRYRVSVMLRRPWEEDPLSSPDASLSIFVGRRNIQIQARTGHGLHRP